MAELALGLLTGTERADALAHLTDCAPCRAEVEQLAQVSDQVLLLTAPAEPPPGFESQVLVALATTAGQPESRSLRRRVMWTAASAAAAALALVIGLAIGSTGSPREDLAWGAAMVTPSGRDVGHVRLRDGEPPWLLVSVPGWKHWDEAMGHPLDYRLRVELAGGRSVEIDGVKLSEAGGWGTTPGFDPKAVREVSIVDTNGRVWCTAQVAPPDT